ncbi:hypothetical protein H0H92_010340 [Tricholoma furcatifolium]|nr:hypothetical protein H0H92_010340 [Tricholoma furcatifolium]
MPPRPAPPPFLPDVNGTRFRLYVEAREKNEASVNGLWFSILSVLYTDELKRLQCFIGPEVQLNGVGGDPNIYGFSDLLVAKGEGAPKQLHILYEGKRCSQTEDPNTAPGFKDVLDQLLKYASTMKVDDFCYLIGAHGRYCKFWEYKKGLGNNFECHGLCVNNQGQVEQYDAGSDEYTYSILNNTHQRSISTLLYHVK